MKSIHFNVKQLFFKSFIYLKHICITTPLGTGDFLADLQNAFRLNGVETCVRNALVLSRRRQNLKDEQEPLLYMKKAQVNNGSFLISLESESYFCNMQATNNNNKGTDVTYHIFCLLQ